MALLLGISNRELKVFGFLVPPASAHVECCISNRELKGEPLDLPLREGLRPASQIEN